MGTAAPARTASDRDGAGGPDVGPHALSIDTEDWAALMSSYVGHQRAASAQFTRTIEQALDLLDDSGARATFFVLGEHARQAPEAVREIAERGHEVASHGDRHLMLSALQREGFREDLRRVTQTLQEITGRPVIGHRCPFFSLLPDQRWAVDLLIDAGMRYDSSLTTLLWHRDGHDVPEQPFSFLTPDGRPLVEFPAPGRKVGPLTVRCLGGRAMRVLPRGFTLGHMRRRNEEGLPAMVYLHSYEIAPASLARYIPRDLGLGNRLKLALSAKAFELGTGRMHGLMRELLARWTWLPMSEVLEGMTQGGALPTVPLDAEAVAEHESPVRGGGDGN